MAYSAEYQSTSDGSGSVGWTCRILKDGDVVYVSPHAAQLPTKLDAEMLAEELIMRLQEAESEAEAG